MAPRQSLAPGKSASLRSPAARDAFRLRRSRRSRRADGRRVRRGAARLPWSCGSAQPRGVAVLVGVGAATELLAAAGCCIRLRLPRLRRRCGHGCVRCRSRRLGPGGSCRSRLERRCLHRRSRDPRGRLAARPGGRIVGLWYRSGPGGTGERGHECRSARCNERGPSSLRSPQRRRPRGHPSLPLSLTHRTPDDQAGQPLRVGAGAPPCARARPLFPPLTSSSASPPAVRRRPPRRPATTRRPGRRPADRTSRGPSASAVRRAAGGSCSG